MSRSLACPSSVCRTQGPEDPAAARVPSACSRLARCVRASRRGRPGASHAGPQAPAPPAARVPRPWRSGPACRQVAPLGAVYKQVHGPEAHTAESWQVEARGVGVPREFATCTCPGGDATELTPGTRVRPVASPWRARHTRRSPPCSFVRCVWPLGSPDVCEVTGARRPAPWALQRQWLPPRWDRAADAAPAPALAGRSLSCRAQPPPSGVACRPPAPCRGAASPHPGHSGAAPGEGRRGQVCIQPVPGSLERAASPALRSPCHTPDPTTSGFSRST